MNLVNSSDSESIVTNALFGILKTCDRLIASYNRRFSEMIGFDGDEGAGMGMSILFPSPEDCDALDKLADSLFGAGKPLCLEVCMRRKDGTVFLAEIRGIPVDPDKLCDGNVWIVDDLSERRKIVATGIRPASQGVGVAPGNRDFVSEEARARLCAATAFAHGAACEDLVAPLERLFDVPGLDVPAGLRRAGGNTEFYRKLLRQFLASQGGVIRDINVALMAANFQLAARLAHALKGGADNIGATQLAQLAAEVDDAIRENGNGKRLRLFLVRLDVALKEIRAQLVVALGMPEMGGGGQAPLFGQVGAELAARLRRRNDDAADYFDSHARVLRKSLLLSEFKALSTAIRHSDYGAALVLLEAMLGEGDGGES